MRIEVTQEDIDHGHRKCCLSCPVARALQRTLKDDRAWAGLESIGSDKLGNNWLTSTPGIVTEFMIDFDADRIVRPFSFDLEVPQ